MTGDLFFIAVIPTDEVAQKVTAVKRDFAERFASLKALRLMPHITLKPPFRLYGQTTALIDWFETLELGLSPFEISLDGFGAFEKTHPVIYIKPGFSEPLNSLRQALINHLTAGFPKAAAPNDLYFNPHMTVAYRDLTAAEFNKAWPEYRLKDFHARFTVRNFHLLQHSGQWSVVATNAMK